MQIIWNAGEMAVSWMFPQVGATLQAYRWANTAYKVTKLSASVLSGDPTCLMGAAKEAVSCASLRDVLIEKCENIKIGPGDIDSAKWKGGCYILAQSTYWGCKLFGIGK